MPIRRNGLVAALAVASGCGALRSAMLRPDYDRADARQTVRLVVDTAPLPAGSERVGALWSEIARRYANDHRDFIVEHGVAGDAPAPGDCAGDVEGVLRLEPKARRDGDRVVGEVRASLVRCRDHALVWEATAAGSWPSADPNVPDVVEHYRTELGDEVGPYVAPAYHLLKAALDALPHPVLDDRGKDQKIDLSD